MNKAFPPIKFDPFLTRFGRTVFYADFITRDLENILQDIPLKRLEEHDKDGYKSYLIVENNYLVHLHEFLGGMIYKSIDDFLFYEKHFELKNENN